MADETRITRTVDPDLPSDELWLLVGDGEGWAAWLVDDADVVVEAGADGTVVDDDERRRVHVDHVEPQERVVFTWWPEDRPGTASTVELVVVPGRLLITETHRDAPVASTAVRWDVRAVMLWAQALHARV